MQNQTAASLTDNYGPSAGGVTQCPSCATAFKVSEKQLQAAKGQVRCGSCMHVFVAADNWASTLPGKTTSPAASPAAKPPTPAAQASEGSTAVPAYGLKHHAKIEFSEAFLALDAKSPGESSLATGAKANEASREDEEWALRILAEEESSTAKKSRNGVLEALLADAAPARPNTGSVETEEPKAYADQAFESTEKWMQELLGGNQPEQAFEAPPPVTRAPQSQQEPDQEYVPEIFRPKNALLDGIQSEPLEMHWRIHISPWVKHGLAGLGIIAATALLFGQYAWFNSERLASNPEYRPLFARFCQLSGCTMPAAIDLSRIKNSNLVVVKHPRVDDSLLLDTVLTNYASFAQPYPLLSVRFSSMQDQTVAARVFTPAEYLRGDLVGSTMMPVRQPIHISLELVDPGERASNYSIQLLAPNSP
jgi:predicted Zn finger-like uncharacterized protein